MSGDRSAAGVAIDRLAAERFPPQDLVPPGCSRNLPYPTVIDPEDPPLRPERHIPNSIATMRRRLIAAIVTRLPRCPCCGGAAVQRGRRRLSLSSTSLDFHGKELA